MTADGTGRNAKQNITGQMHCDLNCSGNRDADYTQHYPNTPDTALEFVCPSCDTVGGGPCGREGHCATAPVTQAAWDLVKPGGDLRSTPFNYDSLTAFNIANKLFYQGSANVGLWYSCDCAAGLSGGCGAGSGYLQWLTADDDNGLLSDGTPHMTAIYYAFNRHGIACVPYTVPAAADQSTGPGTIVPPETYAATQTSNNVREILEETLDDGVSRLVHVWRFDGLTAPVPPYAAIPHGLIVEGYRPNNSENDNFQFYYSSTGVNWTLIPGAIINKAFEPAGGLRYPFGEPYAATMYIKAEDTSVASGPQLTRMNVDFMEIQEGAYRKNSGCAGGPTQAPTLSVTPGSYQAGLSWSAVPGAVKYWVFRTEGHAGCNMGMALIAKPSTTSYTDTEVAAGRQYCYSVMAAGGSGSESSQCFGVNSACQCVTPNL